MTTIRKRVLLHEPALAFELADAFLRSNGRVFEAADDSADAMGDVYRDACRLWLEAASRSPREGRDWISLLARPLARTTTVFGGTSSRTQR